MYKVTLSMPIYNVAPYVERALLSALNQTFESIEFLLVDDRGTDNSMEIVRYIIKDHPRGKDVRIIEHPHNIGTGATKNTAIDNAQGEYLFFMDSDDEITPNCIQLLYDKMMSEKVDMVVGSRERMTNDKVLLKSMIYKDIVIRGNYAILENQYRFQNNRIHIETWNKLYNLKFLRDSGIRCIPNHLNEDRFFSTKIFFSLTSVALTSNLTYHYYIVEGSTMYKNTRGFSDRMADQYIETISYMKENMNFINSKLRRYYYYYLIDYIVYLLPGYLNGNFCERKKKYYLELIRKNMFSPLVFLSCKSFFKSFVLNSPLWVNRLVFKYLK